MTGIKVGETLRANYDTYYAVEDAQWRKLGAIDKASNVVSLCSDVAHRRVLEIGAGDGAILERLSELRFANEYYAVEISTTGVAKIRDKRIAGLVACQLFDGYELPYQNDEFDVAILSHVVEHVEHPRQLLYEAARVATHVFIEVPLEDMSRHARDFTLDRVGHINFFSPRTLRWLVQSCGCDVLKQITTNASKATYTYTSGRRGMLHYYVKQALIDVAPGFATRHFSYHGSLICRKQVAS